MHPPLHINKHPHCKERIEALLQCHADNPWAKYWNVCSDQKILLDKCFREEKVINRTRNLQKARREQERLRLKLDAQRAQQAQQQEGQQQQQQQQEGAQQSVPGAVPGYFVPQGQ